jgi:hypothetical protein
MSYNGSFLMLGDGEHHNATDAAWDFCGNYVRVYSLRLHPDAAANKNADKESPVLE